jgi:hypothetical protein
VTYEHTQKLPENIITAATVGGLVLGLTPPGWILRLATLGVMGTAGVMMKSLTVIIDSTQINIAFGKNIVKKTYSLRDIQSAKAIRTTPLQGWGIHWIGNGWLYNIYGLDAVEVRFINGKRVYIGTDEPKDLTAAINQRLELFGRT